MNTTIKDYLKNQKLICDGAFGTYYGRIYNTDALPEAANITNPTRVKKIHTEYINAGAKLIRTNTFASNTISLNTSFSDVSKNISAACRIADECAANQVFVAGNIGPIPYNALECKPSAVAEYIDICKVFIENGVNAIVFETFPDIEDILPAIEYVHNNSDIFILVQFIVNQFGYSSHGLSCKKLISSAISNPCIDAVGLNCGVGPSHMQKLFEKADFSDDKYISAFPNAGYPQNMSNRAMYSSDNADYFSDKAAGLSKLGISIIGGCCGTTPEYIKKICSSIDINDTCTKPKTVSDIKPSIKVTDNSFYGHSLKKDSSHKLIAVELAPPFGNDDEKLMDAAHLLKNCGVDVLTFPDSPSGRTRADSILVAEKVSRETGMCVMPHLCCRDKNAIAMRSQLLGAYINGINNFLVITGDPIPSVMRQSIKSVFNFDSVGLMNIIDSMNNEHFYSAPITFGGAINQNRTNLDVEIRRLRKKMDSGASFFLTQPAFSKESVDRLYRIKQETGARILCGIMPLVSKKNALFMKNEMTGIDVPDSVVERYNNALTKEDGENTGIEIAKEIMKMADFCDGYYFSFPFNRVYMLDKILK